MKYILLRNGIKQNGFGKWGYKIVFPLYISGEGQANACTSVYNNQGSTQYKET